MWRAWIAAMGWLTLNSIAGTVGYAAAPPQAQQDAGVPAKGESTSAPEKPKPKIGLFSDESDSVTLPHSVKGFGERFLFDQVQIWTFPRHLSWADADIIVPFSMGTAGFLATDSDFSRGLSNSPSRLNNSVKFSNYGIGAMAGIGGGLYVWGHFTHDDHKKETGFLAGEAAVNAYRRDYRSQIYLWPHSAPRSTSLLGSFLEWWQLRCLPSMRQPHGPSPV